MILKNSHALLAVLALAAAPAFAQDAETPATDGAATMQPAAETATESAAETPAEAATDTELTSEAAPAADETPAEADTEPRVGSYYLRTTHNDWSVRCIKTEQEQDPCELYQLMKDEDGNAVAEITLIPLRNGNVAAGATLIAPLETDLVHGLGFSIDAAAPRGYPFSFCAPVGCVSRMGFTADELNGMKRGNKATVTLLPFGGNPDQPVRLNLSLSGFTAAFDEVGKLAEAAGDAAPTILKETPPASKPAE